MQKKFMVCSNTRKLQLCAVHTETLDIVQAVVELQLACDDIDFGGTVSEDTIPELAGFLVTAVPGDVYTVLTHDEQRRAGAVICVN